MRYGSAVTEGPENPPPPAPGLPELRARLDEVDRRVVELLAERMRVVTEVARFKKSERVDIRDSDRERQVLDARRKLARELGLDPAPVEAIYRQILNASRDYQAALGASVYERTQPKQVAIIGGAGAMGGVLTRLFRDLGHVVEIADLDTALTPEAAAARADVVVISVPILTTEAVIRRLGPSVRKDALLLDVTSIKSVPLRAMLESTSASVVGTHPMFGPNTHSLQGQRVVVCKGRGDAWHAWVLDNLRARGLVVTEAGAEQHDRAMSLVQVLTHFQTQVFGWALARSGISLEESRRFTSPAYLMELYVAARHFAQASDLYGPIEMLNPETGSVVAAFQQAADELAAILSTRDQARFDAMFREVREFFGEFAKEATEQSSYLIDHLVERTT
jgi:chorismate mutase/prephenate dehydrogenase